MRIQGRKYDFLSDHIIVGLQGLILRSVLWIYHALLFFPCSFFAFKKFYIVNIPILTYVPAHERQTVRVLEDAAQRDAQHYNRKRARDLATSRLTGANPHGRTGRVNSPRDGDGKPDRC